MKSEITFTALQKLAAMMHEDVVLGDEAANVSGAFYNGRFYESPEELAEALTVRDKAEITDLISYGSETRFRTYDDGIKYSDLSYDRANDPDSLAVRSHIKSDLSVIPNPEYASAPFALGFVKMKPVVPARYKGNP
jgi:hypothetical protein